MAMGLGIVLFDSLDIRRKTNLHLVLFMHCVDDFPDIAS